MIRYSKLQQEAEQLLIDNDFDLVDDISKTYRTEILDLKIRFSVKPIYSLLSCTVTVIHGEAIGISLIDKHALLFLREYAPLLKTLSSSEEIIYEIHNKFKGTIYNKNI